MLARGGHIDLVDKGKPTKRWRRKTTGLREFVSTTAELPTRVLMIIRHLLPLLLLPFPFGSRVNVT